MTKTNSNPKTQKSSGVPRSWFVTWAPAITVHAVELNFRQAPAVKSGFQNQRTQIFDLPGYDLAYRWFAPMTVMSARGGMSALAIVIDVAISTVTGVKN